HDAGLHHGVGEYRRDRLWEALETIDHRDQDVAGAAVANLAHHPQPELRPLGLFDPKAQDLLVTRAAHADGQVHRLVLDHPFVADLHSYSVEEHDRVCRLQRPGLAGGD